MESKSMAIINQVLVAVAAAPSSLEPRVTDCPEGSGVDSSSMPPERRGGGGGFGKSEKVKINLITSTRRIGRCRATLRRGGGYDLLHPLAPSTLLRTVCAMSAH